LQNAPLAQASLAEFYRFALLLTGNSEAAERIVADTLLDSDAELGEIRNSTRREACFASRVRQRCLKDLTPCGEETENHEGMTLARKFANLQEPERSALALFYLDLFSPDEIASVLKMKPEDLAETLAHARGLLKEVMEAGT
jgi:DNA-directed RNA polymerase specialized sigma24 family protein